MKTTLLSSGSGGADSLTASPLTYIKQNHRGKENSIRAEILCNLFNISRRELRELVAEANKRLIPILFSSDSNGGIFYATKQSEIDEFIKREIDSRIASLSKRKQALQKIVIVEEEIKPKDFKQGKLF